MKSTMNKARIKCLAEANLKIIDLTELLEKMAKACKPERFTDERCNCGGCEAYRIYEAFKKKI